MRSANWLIAAGLIVATAGCVETGYPTPYAGSTPGYAQSGYGYGYGSGYAYGRQQPGYHGQQGYYQPVSYYSPRRWW
jgi:hypothetical protein